MRATTAQRLAFTPLESELVQDTQSKYLYIGDGTTPGGVLAAPLAAVSNKISIVVRNETGATLLKGYPFAVIGTVSGVTKIVKGDAAGDYIISGVLEADVSNNSTGLGTLDGEISNIDLSAFSDGQSAYLAAGGGLTPTKPVEPNKIVYVGEVSKSGVSGILLVRIGDFVDFPNLPNNHVPIGQTAGNTTTVNIDTKISANTQVTAATAHIANTSNPHNVTKAQVGLGNVDNTSDANKPVSTAQQAAIDLKVDKTTTVNGHALSANVVVTKSDVGLGNVDNTSDANKPISTATQTALNLKYDSSNPNGYETPAQLNARDTANRARANHTGTQLAATISDFASTVLATLLTGLSLATGGVISATDTILIALGKLQKQITDNLTSLNNHIADTANPHAVTKTQVGLSNVDNTSDATKNVLSATKLTTPRNINGVAFDGTANITIADSTKEPTITAGTTGQYWRGDKSFQTLDKTAVGLGNVDNTSDVNKPVSTAQAAADSAVQSFAIQRANHTGTQLAATISDFAATVRGTVLTGLSLATAQVIAATDSVLLALGYLQAQVTLRALAARQIINGYGITGGGDLTADRTLAVSLTTAIIEQTASVASTNTADTTIASFTVNAPATGDYLATISARIETNTGDSAGTCRMFANGAAQTATIRTFGAIDSTGLSTVSIQQSIHIVKKLTLTSGQAVDLRWSHSAGGFNILDRSITLLRIS